MNDYGFDQCFTINTCISASANISEYLLNKIRQMVYFLYWENKTQNRHIIT